MRNIARHSASRAKYEALEDPSKVSVATILLPLFLSASQHFIRQHIRDAVGFVREKVPVHVHRGHDGGMAAHLRIRPSETYPERSNATGLLPG